MTTFFYHVGVKIGVVGGEGVFDEGRVGLEGLDDDGGGRKVATTDATDDLSEKLESFFFGREVGEGKSGVGLDDADRGEAGKVEATRNGLGADDDLDVAVFDFGIERIEGFAFFVVGVKAGDTSLSKKFVQLAFEEFGAKTFMEDRGVVAVGARGRDFFGKAAGVAEEGVSVGVESEGEETVGAESLPTTVFTESERGGAATVVVDKGLVAIFKVFFDGV